MVATDGVGTKDLNRYVVVYLTNYIYSFRWFWWQNEPKITIIRLTKTKELWLQLEGLMGFMQKIA